MSVTFQCPFCPTLISAESESMAEVMVDGHMKQEHAHPSMLDMDKMLRRIGNQEETGGHVFSKRTDSVITNTMAVIFGLIFGILVITFFIWVITLMWRSILG